MQSGTKQCMYCGSSDDLATEHWGVRNLCVTCRKIRNRGYQETYYRASPEVNSANCVRRRKRVLKRRQEEYLHSPSRRLLASIRRATVPPNMRWCYFGEHYVDKSLFYHDGGKRTRSTYCKKCRKMYYRAYYLTQKRKKLKLAQ